MNQKHRIYFHESATPELIFSMPTISLFVDRSQTGL